jgi:hypothetical protein
MRYRPGKMVDSKEGVKGAVEVQEGEVSNNEDFENLLNFRDVGKTINNFLGAKYVEVILW